MCNRFVQQGWEVRPGQRVLVLMRGSGGEFEVPFEEAVFGGPARNESRHYWIQREGAEPVLVPDISRFGEKDKTTEEQTWEDVPAGSSMEGLLLPRPASPLTSFYKRSQRPSRRGSLGKVPSIPFAVSHPRKL